MTRARAVLLTVAPCAAFARSAMPVPLVLGGLLGVVLAVRRWTAVPNGTQAH